MASRDVARASVRLPVELKAAIQKIANEEGRTVTSTIQLLLKREIANYDSRARLEITDEWLDKLAEKIGDRLTRKSDPSGNGLIRKGNIFTTRG
jgi:hypothetical protein